MIVMSSYFFLNRLLSDLITGLAIVHMQDVITHSMLLGHKESGSNFIPSKLMTAMIDFMFILELDLAATIGITFILIIGHMAMKLLLKQIFFIFTGTQMVMVMLMGLMVILEEKGRTKSMPNSYYLHCVVVFKQNLYYHTNRCHTN